MNEKIKLGLVVLTLAVVVSGLFMSVSLTQANTGENLENPDTGVEEVDAGKYAKCGGIQGCRSNCGCGCAGNPSACGCGG